MLYEQIVYIVNGTDVSRHLPRTDAEVTVRA
jgi:hypothetical protein